MVCPWALNLSFLAIPFQPPQVSVLSTFRTKFKLSNRAYEALYHHYINLVSSLQPPYVPVTVSVGVSVVCIHTLTVFPPFELQAFKSQPCPFLCEAPSPPPHPTSSTLYLHNDVLVFLWFSVGLQPFSNNIYCTHTVAM